MFVSLVFYGLKWPNLFVYLAGGESNQRMPYFRPYTSRFLVSSSIYLSYIPSQVQSMEEGYREPPIGYSCSAHQGMNGANRGQVACILGCKTSSCYGIYYTKVLISS